MEPDRNKELECIRAGLRKVYKPIIADWCKIMARRAEAYTVFMEEEDER